MAGPRVPGGIAHRERDASNRCDTLTLVGAVEAGRGDLLASLAALGRSLQETFDPQRFLAEFSERVLVCDSKRVICARSSAKLTIPTPSATR